MSKTLLVLCHPNFKNSFANKILVDKIKAKIPDIEIDNIHELYPDLKIDVKAEQEKLLKANTIILAFPMFWFSCPHFLSKWIEDVFAHGFAYGTNAYKLEGKKMILSMTMGGPKDEFQGKFDLDRLIGHFEATALFVKMKFGGYAYTLDIPFTIKDTPDIAKTKSEEIEKQAQKLCELVKN